MRAERAPVGGVAVDGPPGGQAAHAGKERRPRGQGGVEGRRVGGPERRVDGVLRRDRDRVRGRAANRVAEVAVRGVRGLSACDWRFEPHTRTRGGAGVDQAVLLDGEVVWLPASLTSLSAGALDTPMEVAAARLRQAGRRAERAMLLDVRQAGVGDRLSLWFVW